MKNKNFLEAVRCAFRGAGYALRTEKNFRRYFVIAMIFLVINLALRVPLYVHITAIITISITFAFEVVNTAIEHICDSFSTELSPDIRVIKDLAAGAVLMSSLSFFISEIIFIVLQIIKLASGGAG